jgi:hypothetical protein
MGSVLAVLTIRRLSPDQPGCGDLGELSMDAGAIERLRERMRRSGAQEASIGRDAVEHEAERQAGSSV